jgi:hypothetical protein
MTSSCRSHAVCVAGSRLFLSQVGNHESDYPNTASNVGYGKLSGGECSVVSQIVMPHPINYTLIGMASPHSERDKYNEPWYSYDIGLVHILSMSTEHNFTVGSKQYLFIKQDLENVDKSLTPWIVFIGHRPMYVNSNWVSSILRIHGY